MSRPKKLVIVAGLLLVLALLLEFQAYLYPAWFAEKRAGADMRGLCSRMRLDPQLLVDVHRAQVGNTAWAFEATYTGSPKRMLGVWYHQDGSPEFYSEVLE